MGRNPSLPHTTKKKIVTNLKINKQSEVPENQTAWSSDQGIKETVKIKNRLVKTCGKVADHAARAG